MCWCLVSAPIAHLCAALPRATVVSEKCFRARRPGPKRALRCPYPLTQVKCLWRRYLCQVCGGGGRWGSAFKNRSCTPPAGQLAAGRAQRLPACSWRRRLCNQCIFPSITATRHTLGARVCRTPPGCTSPAAARGAARGSAPTWSGCTACLAHGSDQRPARSASRPHSGAAYPACNTARPQGGNGVCGHIT